MKYQDFYECKYVLRICVIKESKVLTDYLLMPDEKFDIGKKSNKIKILEDDEYILFNSEKSDYFVNLSYDKAIYQLYHDNKFSLIDSTPGEKLPIDKKTKGRIIIGDWKIIFQLISAPPISMMNKYYPKKEQTLEEDDILFMSLIMFNSVIASLLLIYANYFYIIPEPPEPSVEDIIAMLNISIQEEKPIEEEKTIKEDKKEKSKEKTIKEEMSNEKEKDKLEEKIKSVDDLINELENIGKITDEINNGKFTFLDKQDNNLSEYSISDNEYDLISSEGIKISSANGRALESNSTDIKITNAVKNKEPVTISKGPKVDVPIRKTSVKETKITTDNKKCDIEIKKIIKQKNGNISFCYDRLILEFPDEQGRLDVVVKIKKAENEITILDSSISNKTFRNCIERKIKKWKFSDFCENTTFKKSYILKNE